MQNVCTYIEIFQIYLLYSWDDAPTLCIDHLPKYLTVAGIESETITQCRNFDGNIDHQAN